MLLDVRLQPRAPHVAHSPETRIGEHYCPIVVAMPDDAAKGLVHCPHCVLHVPARLLAQQLLSLATWSCYSTHHFSPDSPLEELRMHSSR
jgi:hypothetical protein